MEEDAHSAQSKNDEANCVPTSERSSERETEEVDKHTQQKALNFLRSGRQF